MDLNKLVNQRVTHTRFGDGQIINITKNNVSVKFKTGGVQFFSFPNTFKNNIIRFIDINHDEVIAEIDASLTKKAETQKIEKTQEVETQKGEEILEVIEEIVEDIEPLKVVEEVIENITLEENKKGREDGIIESYVEPEFTTNMETIPSSLMTETEEVLEVFIHEEYTEEEKKVKEKYNFDGFLNEFYDYWGNRKLLAPIVFKYANVDAVYKELKDLVLKIILETLDREEKFEEKGFVTLFIAMIAHKHYDGTLWSFIETELEDIYQIKDKLHVNKTIRRLIRDNDFGGETSVLIHAGVFVKFYKDYYVFLYDIYKLNFDYNLVNVPIEQILSDTFSGLKNDLIKQDGEEFHLRLTNKTYYLSKSTKQALIIGPDEMAKVAKSFIRHIDLWYHNNKYDKTEVQLHRALRIWLDIEGSKISKVLVNEKNYINKATFKLNSNTLELNLIFPNIVIRGLSNFDYRRLDVELIDGKNKISLNIDSDYRIYQRIGYHSISIFEHVIKNPLERVELVIAYNKAPLYLSDEKLNREFYLFNDKGEELVDLANYHGHIYLIHKVEEQLVGAKEYNFSTHKVSYLKVDKKKGLKLGDQNLKFKRDLKIGLDGVEVSGLVLKTEGETYPVYRSLKSFVFESDLKAADLVFSINGVTEQLTKFITEDNIYDEMFQFEIKLDKLDLKSDLYHLEIKDIKNNLIAFVNFQYDEGLNFRKRLIVPPLLYDFTIDSAFNIIENKKYNYDLSKKYDVSFKFKLNNKPAEYFVPLDIPRYKYAINQPWKLLEELELISKDLILTNDIAKVLVKWPGNDIFELAKKTKTNEYTIYDLNSLKGYNSVYGQKVKLVFEFVSGATKEHILYVQPELIGKPYVTFSVNGELEVNFDIKCFEADKWILELTDPFGGKKHLDLRSKTIIVQDVMPFKKYLITIKDKQNVLYGVKMSEFYEDTFTFVDSEGLFGETFKTSKIVYYDEESNENEVAVNDYAIKFIRKIKRNEAKINMTSLDINNVCYECELYHLSRTETLRDFNYKGKLYCEIASPRSSQIMKLKIEDEVGQKITFDSKRLELSNRYKKKNTPVELYIIDALKDNIE